MDGCCMMLQFSASLLIFTHFAKALTCIFFCPFTRWNCLIQNVSISYLGALELGIVLHIAFEIILWVSETKQSEICNPNQVSQVMGQHCKWLRLNIVENWFDFNFVAFTSVNWNQCFRSFKVLSDATVISVNQLTLPILQILTKYAGKNWGDFLALLFPAQASPAWISSLHMCWQMWATTRESEEERETIKMCRNLAENVKVNWNSFV